MNTHENDTLDRLLPVIDSVIAQLRSGNSYESVMQRFPELNLDDIKTCHEIGMRRLNREAVSQPVYCRLDTPRK